MKELMNLKRVYFDDSKCWEYIDPSVFIVYDINADDNTKKNVRFVYPM